MEFSWDEDKRLRTLADRNLDFLDANLFFDGRPVLHVPSPRNSEDRVKSTAQLGMYIFTLVWMWRGRKQHIISIRRAHAKEIREYRQLHYG